MEVQLQQYPQDGVQGGVKAKASRSVARLNAEQLAKKRAADRKSQQILRQKTRRHIERLEERVRELQDQESELERAERRTLYLEEELSGLKAFIANIQGQTAITIKSTSSAAPPPRQANIDSTLQSSTSSVITLDSSPVPEPHGYPTHIDHPLTFEALPLPELSNIPNSEPEISTAPAFPVSPDTSTIIKRKPSGKHVSISFRSPPRFIPQDFSPQRPNTVPTSFVKQPTVHVWELPLRLKKPDSPVDKILYGVIEAQKALAAGGASRAVAIGPNFPNVNVLVAPKLAHISHPVSRMLCDLLKRMTYRTFIDKLGALMVMYPLYQWQIMNDYESFLRLPSHSIPCLSQRTTPHHVWICALGPPKLREAVIADQEKYCTEEFIYSFIMSLNCNWKKRVEDAMCCGKHGVTVTKEFWDHCNVLDNWTMGPPFSTKYPELRHTVRFTYELESEVKLGEVEELQV